MYLYEQTRYGIESGKICFFFLTFTFVATDELRSVRKIYGWKNFARGDETTQIRKKKNFQKTFNICSLSPFKYFAFKEVNNYVEVKITCSFCWMSDCSLKYWK